MMTDLATMRQLAAAVAALDHRQGDDLPMIGGDDHHPDVTDYDVWLPIEAAAFALADAVAEIDRLRAALAEACDRGARLAEYVAVERLGRGPRPCLSVDEDAFQRLRAGIDGPIPPSTSR